MIDVSLEIACFRPGGRVDMSGGDISPLAAAMDWILLALSGCDSILYTASRECCHDLGLITPRVGSYCGGLASARQECEVPFGRGARSFDPT